MSVDVRLNKLADILESRVRNTVKAQGPKRQKEALLRIAFAIENQTKVNIRNQGLVDEGQLINSISHRILETASGTSLEVGSYGVPYAAIHEFGGLITPKQSKALTIPLSRKYKKLRARDLPDLFPITLKNGKGFLVRKRGDGSLEFAYMFKDSVKIPQRSYLRPAVRKLRGRILDEVRRLHRK